jgi:hypothetical protein
MNKKTKITGECHCGNIQYQYELDLPIDKFSIRSCSCSFCTKQGAIYTSDPEGKLTVNIKSHKDIRQYQFASKVIDFVFCNKCGVMPFAMTKIDDTVYTVINIKTQNKALIDLPVHVNNFDQESVDDSIKRRKTKWISKIEGNLWKF